MMFYRFFILFYCFYSVFIFGQTGIDSVEIAHHHIETEKIQKLNKEGKIDLMDQLSQISGIQKASTGTAHQIFFRGLNGARVGIFQYGFEQAEQQWGSDHGVLINPAQVNEIVFVPGAGIRYGGKNQNIIFVDPVIPTKNGLNQSLDFGYGFQDYLLYQHWNLQWKSKKFFITTDFLAKNQSNLPLNTDKFSYLDQEYNLPEKNLTNTANFLYQFKTQMAFLMEEKMLKLHLDYTNQKTGYFPLEVFTANQKIDKEDVYTIYAPYMTSQHLRVGSRFHSHFINKKWHSTWETELQWNRRKEFGPEGHDHDHDHADGHDHGNLDYKKAIMALQLDLITLNDRWSLSRFLTDRLEVEMGWDFRFQNNKIGGFEHLVPDYFSLNNGVFNRWVFHQNQKINYLFAFRVNHHFFDAKASEKNNSLQVAHLDYAINAGFFGKIENLNWQTNLSKTYRNPEAIEFLANGYHHAALRTEIGNPFLKPEESIGIDQNLSWSYKGIEIGFSPYFNYFWNYIYLQPQNNNVFSYKHSPVFHTGFEWQAKIQLFDFLSLHQNLDFVYLIDTQEKKYLPFTSPLHHQLKLAFLFPFSSQKWGLDVVYDYFHKQFNTVKEEIPAAAYHLFGIDGFASFPFKKTTLNLGINVKNIFDIRYFSALNHYKKIGLYDPSRSIAIHLKLNF